MLIYNTVTAKTATVLWPRGQAVKTSPFHGGNTGSIPVGVICRFPGQIIFIKSVTAEKHCSIRNPDAQCSQ